MRTLKSFEYKEEHEDIICKFVSETPRTTKAITIMIKDKVFSKIHAMTVKRLLENLWKRGKIKKFTVGRIVLWQL